MRLIFFTLFILAGLNASAQEMLIGTKWEIQEYYTSFDEIPGERNVYYTSALNADYTMHLNGLVYDFQVDKVEMFYIDDLGQTGSQPVIYSGGNQVTINEVLYTIEEISADYLKLVNTAYYIETPEESVFPISTVMEFKKHSSNVTNVSEQLTEFHIAPNPVKDKIVFKENVQSIQIFDSTGKLVCGEMVNGQSVDLSFLQSGYYILKVKTIKGMKHTRIVKE